MRILSGIKPTGTIHIGNYLGMIRPMVESQNRGELFCFVANLHSLTNIFDAEKMFLYTNEMVLDLLALGIDPEKSVFWVQSDLPEVTELTWYLNNITPVGLLERCHAYKDAIAKNIPPNTGLFCYPVLMNCGYTGIQFKHCSCWKRSETACRGNKRSGNKVQCNIRGGFHNPGT